MSKLIWFIFGLFLGEFWAGWLMHIVYVGIILLLLWSGHHPVRLC